MIRQVLQWIGDIGQAVPSLERAHRGMFFSERTASTEDELYYAVADSSDAMQARRILTETYADTLYEARKSTATNWTSEVGAAMGASPGSITQAGAEYTGRIIADTGGSGTTTGVLFTITFATNRGNSNYNVFLNPQNAETARCQVYAINASGTTFTIRAQVAPNTGTEIRVGWLIEDRTP